MAGRLLVHGRLLLTACDRIFLDVYGWLPSAGRLQLGAYYSRPKTNAGVAGAARATLPARHYFEAASQFVASVLSGTV